VTHNSGARGGGRVSKPIPRIYADTSVFGGAFDDEFSEASLRLFDAIRMGGLPVTGHPKAGVGDGVSGQLRAGAA